MAYLYKRMKKQVSYDNGKTWEDVNPPEYIIGDLIDNNSDCTSTETQNTEEKSPSSE